LPGHCQDRGVGPLAPIRLQLQWVPSGGSSHLVLEFSESPRADHFNQYRSANLCNLNFSCIDWQFSIRRLSVPVRARASLPWIGATQNTNCIARPQATWNACDKGNWYTSVDLTWHCVCREQYLIGLQRQWLLPRNLVADFQA